MLEFLRKHTAIILIAAASIATISSAACCVWLYNDSFKPTGNQIFRSQKNLCIDNVPIVQTSPRRDMFVAYVGKHTTIAQVGGSPARIRIDKSEPIRLGELDAVINELTALREWVRIDLGIKQ